MNRQEKLEFLKNNPVFWSRLGFSYDPPLKNAEGHPLVFTPDLNRDAEYHRDFAKIGVKIHTTILHLGWMGVDEYDYSLTDAVLEKIFSCADDIFYIPRIKLNVPVDWCRENPNDVFVYWNGPKTADEIRSLIDTPLHDWFGYNAPHGYYKSGDFTDTRANVGGTVARQSFSSKKWLTDAGKALKKFIERLENSPYKDRILGYHISFGVSGESILWGRADNRYGDYGINNTKNFLEWTKNKYGGEQELLNAWENDLSLPSPEERYSRFDKIEEFMRSDRIGKISRDMDEFTSSCAAYAIEYFSDIVKSAAPEKLTGAFYGYFVHTDNPNYAGHLELERLLQGSSPDFFAAPKSYYRCGPGEPGGEMCPTQSVNLKKLWVDESDNRTHLASDDVAEWVCRDMNATRWVMWREFCKNISHDSGFWWMDLGGGWFNSPEIMEEVKLLKNTSDKLRAIPHSSIADMLVIVDEKSIYSMGVSEKLRCGFMEDFLCEVTLSGVVADVYRLSDIRQIDFSRYKAIVFAYTFDISSNDRAYLEKTINPDTFLIYHWAAGVICDGNFSLDNAKIFTGFSLINPGKSEFDFPEITVTDTDTEPFGNNGRRRGKKFIFTKPFIPHDDIREYAMLAGCKIRTNSSQILRADNRVVGVFSKKKLEGELIMPEKAVWKEVITEQIFEETSVISLEKFNSDFAVFVREK